MGDMKRILLKLLLYILLMPIYLLANIFLVVISVINAVLGKIGGFIGFFLVLIGFLGLIGISPVATDNKAGDIIMLVAGVLCYIIPIVIDEIIEGLQNFSAWIMETVVDA